MRSIEMLRLVYEKLGDEESRFIFQNRLLYSVSEDERMIRKMVNGLMERYGEDDMMNRLLKWTGLKSRDLVVFGAGFAGCQIVRTLQDFDIPVSCIADNNSRLWGSQRYGVKILAPDELSERAECRVIIGVNHGVDVIHRQLTAMGMKEEDLYIPEKQWWLGKNCQYFDSVIVSPKEHEVFLDGGSLDGEDSMRFIDWCKGRYDKIYAFEPDKNNCRKLSKLAEKHNRVTVYQEGLWSENTELKFSSGNAENSCISESGDLVVKAVSIDEKLGQERITFVKMDIEGSEYEALLGAEKTIRNYKPKLAVCVYHKPEDIFEIPLKILEYCPDYKLYLRHYSYADTETVLYAV